MGGEARLGRFQVMALLQAARYFLLTGDREKAFSFGLNRAIFYAWAKRRGVPVAASRERVSRGAEVTREGGRGVVYVGDEQAFVSDNGWFTMGGEEQRPEDFEREVARRIEAVMPFEEAWKLALDYVSSFDRRVLLSQREFYEKVYLPVRDSFPNISLKKGGGQTTLF
ncbi:hypothetical protein [Infirmifilum sp. NZ]|uniref:hypothetical protein n=1 Tax=Infirmifilum sp. NZ TaxID=2926850 RepID=UPI00279C6029|nr:hypothetical protein [Infirmifilum sp. NZ]UNQ74360.1 hypothetical protein MOV14_02940 [Infirmifilum sp. NZ]